MRSNWINSWQLEGRPDLSLPHDWETTHVPPVAHKVKKAARETLSADREAELIFSSEQPIAPRSSPMIPPPSHVHTKQTVVLPPQKTFTLWPPILLLVGLWIALCWNARVETEVIDEEETDWLEPLKQSAETAIPQIQAAQKELRRRQR